MDYHDKLDIVRNTIITESTQRITENWERMFDMWLMYEADWEFPYIYKKAFNHQFAQYIKPEINTLFYVAGKNIVFAINTYMSVKNDADLYDVLTFVERFIGEQLDDFDNWCDDIGTAMYEESSEYEIEIARENNAVSANRQTEQDDNPQ